LFSASDTVAGDTPAFLAIPSRFMTVVISLVELKTKTNL
jgi:hypothetical protein